MAAPRQDDGEGGWVKEAVQALRDELHDHRRIVLHLRDELSNYRERNEADHAKVYAVLVEIRDYLKASVAEASRPPA